MTKEKNLEMLREQENTFEKHGMYMVISALFDGKREEDNDDNHDNHDNNALVQTTYSTNLGGKLGGYVPRCTPCSASKDDMLRKEQNMLLVFSLIIPSYFQVVAGRIVQCRCVAFWFAFWFAY